MRYIAPLIILSSLFSSIACADDLSGTWTYEKAAEYFGTKKNIAAPAQTTIQLVNGKLALPPSCFVKFKKEKFDFSDAFQSLLKQDVEEKALDNYLVKTFAFPLSKVKEYYRAETTPDNCNRPFRDVFVLDGRLIVSYAGSTFYSYIRSDGGTAKAATVDLYGHKVTHLPFNVASYSNVCDSFGNILKNSPATTAKCAPVYFPYAANKKDRDALTQLVGTHDYKKGGAPDAQGYDNPLANDLHPYFLVLPPLKDVILVRVNDYEQGDKAGRDGLSGAYLAIKGGAVTDQLNEGCNMNTDYSCADDSGKKLYQLLETGKFKKLN